MITVAKSSDGSHATVTGDKAEMMLFFCFWQTILWPGWIQNSLQSLSGVEHHKRAVHAILDNGNLLLHDADRRFEDACLFAISRCRSLGIEVTA